MKEAKYVHIPSAEQHTISSSYLIHSHPHKLRTKRSVMVHITSSVKNAHIYNTTIMSALQLLWMTGCMLIKADETVIFSESVLLSSLHATHTHAKYSSKLFSGNSILTQ